MSVLANVGIPNPPPGDFFQWVRNTLVELQSAMLPPKRVSNLRATALAGAIQVDFTRSDGDRYILYWNTAPSINGSVRIDMGTSNKYVDSIGSNGVTRFYAVRAKRGNVGGDVSAWVSATTLNLTVNTAPPAPPPGSDAPARNQQSDSVEIQFPSGGGYESV